MKIIRFLSKALKQIMRYAGWLWRHYEEIAPLLDLIKKLVKNAEAEGGTGDEKRERVLRRAAKCISASDAPADAINLVLEQAVCEMNDRECK